MENKKQLDMITFHIVENSIEVASVVNGLIFQLISLTFLIGFGTMLRKKNNHWETDQRYKHNHNTKATSCMFQMQCKKRLKSDCSALCVCVCMMKISASHKSCPNAMKSFCMKLTLTLFCTLWMDNVEILLRLKCGQCPFYGQLWAKSTILSFPACFVFFTIIHFSVNVSLWKLCVNYFPLHIFPSIKHTQAVK